MIKVIIAVDHGLFREGLRLILQRDKSIEIIGEVNAGKQAINLIRDLIPDVVLLHLDIPQTECLEIISSIKERTPSTKVLLVFSSLDDSMVFRALLAGAKGYLSKETSASGLIKSIHSVHRGELWVNGKLMARFFDQDETVDLKKGNLIATPNHELTTKKQKILKYLAKGYTNKEIANTLFISEKTIKNHLNTIFRKLNVTRRVEAILYVVNHGLRED